MPPSLSSLVLSEVCMELFSSVSCLSLMLAGGTCPLTETLLKRCACFGESFSRILIICRSPQYTYIYRLFDLLSMSKAQVHVWPNCVEIISIRYEDIVFTQLFRSLHPVTLTFDLLIPKANQHMYEPNIKFDPNWVKFLSLVFEIWHSQGFQVFACPAVTLTFDLLTPKSNQHIYKPKYICDQIGWNSLHWILRYGVHKVFGTHRQMHSRTHLWTDRPKYRMPLAPLFNSARGINIESVSKACEWTIYQIFSHPCFSLGASCARPE